MTKREYWVTGMSCGHCENAIRDEVGKIAGVEQIEVSAATGSLIVVGSSPIEHSPVLAAVDEAGYEAVPA